MTPWGHAFDDPQLVPLGAAIRERAGRLFARSVHVREVSAGCCNACDLEVQAITNPIFDASRFGIQFVASPRHADLLLVTGVVSRNMLEPLIRTYNAMPDPKLVVAVGACAIDGGIFKGAYGSEGGVASCHLPVAVSIPGCPPRPQAILHGILLALDRLEQKVGRSERVVRRP